MSPCPRTPIEEQQQPGASGHTLALVINAKPCPSSHRPNRARVPCSLLHTLPRADKIRGPLPHRTQCGWSLDSYYEEHRGTAPLTWLMKRLLRFSLTVKTKDATEMLHTCVLTPGRLLRMGLCVKVTSFHQPTYPAAQLRLKKCDLHTCRCDLC